MVLPSRIVSRPGCEAAKANAPRGRGGDVYAKPGPCDPCTRNDLCALVDGGPEEEGDEVQRDIPPLSFLSLLLLFSSSPPSSAPHPLLSLPPSVPPPRVHPPTSSFSSPVLPPLLVPPQQSPSSPLSPPAEAPGRSHGDTRHEKATR